MALKTYSLPGLFGEAGRKISFHYAEHRAVQQRLEIAVAGLEAHRGSPCEVIELSDVYVIPGLDTMALYDRDGRRIDASCTRRGLGLGEIISARETIEPPADCHTLSGPFVYLSVYFNHWGHFLTESASRMWARYEHPELAGLPAFFGAFSRGNRHNEITAQFLDSFSRAPLKLVKAFGPTRIERCFLPAPSFANRAFAFSAHREAIRDAAATLLAGVEPEQDARPVYLSRSRLTQGNRFLVNEPELDEAIEARGWLVVHPQEMSLAEQARLWNAHRTIVACVGSALHSSLLALHGEETTIHILSEKFPNVNCLMIDAIVGNESHYVYTCHKDPDTPGRLTIDLEATLAYLDQAI